MTKQTLNTENADALIYENEIIRITTLGGIKLSGLDRMRATLKVELPKTSHPPVRHNLDLYNDGQLEKFIRRCAEKLETGTNVLSASLDELVSQLERYRLEEIRKELEPVVKPITLSTEDRRVACDFLSSPSLLERTSFFRGT